LRRERGGLEEIAGSLEPFVAEYPTFFIFRCLLANVHVSSATMRKHVTNSTGASDKSLDELRRVAQDGAG
jgi:hypothetical protein